MYKITIEKNASFSSFYDTLGMTKLSVSLWNPEEDSSKKETTKLLHACNKIFNLFGINLFDDEEIDEE